MSTQIAIRLPDELLDEIDARVREGMALNRTDLIRTLLSAALRRSDIDAERRILTAPWADPDDLGGLAAWTSRLPED